ncbi:RNA polymerase sigma factor [Tenuibacillus multivorans]|uniref:RNA polymerase sigma factor n=1 Tax=Tenuibacillus multivorans TaxID=237069 RepID=A0A1G9YNX5_9BACI|nr:RNA polymerase sigma factor [Tenuibacillus multivorans]GEL78490.1 ECF RNA polymerase sigma factor SigX [Tenuibacillus multivorans]SDN10764.1 RNA polymerase sigma-70 factor, ECF subfamily [Tenuibacillus multivorans]
MRRSEIISEWFQQYHQDVYNFLVYYTGKLDTEDLVQEVFIKALNGIDRFDGRSSPKTWLFSIARNVAVDESRKQKRRGSGRTVTLDKAPEVRSDRSPEDILQDHELKRQLYESIQSLKSNYREVLILRGIKDLTVAETAAVLGWSESKVKTTYSRAIKTLRMKQGGTRDE